MCLTVRCFMFFVFWWKTIFPLPFVAKCHIVNACNRQRMYTWSQQLYHQRWHIPFTTTGLRFRCVFSCLIHYPKNDVTYCKRKGNLWQSEDVEGCFFPNLSSVSILKKHKLFLFACLSKIALGAEAITLQNRLASWSKSVRISCWTCWK